jgi:hypothetical protein
VNTMKGDTHDAQPKDAQENLGALLNPDRWSVESDSLGEVEQSLFTLQREGSASTSGGKPGRLGEFNSGEM